ncbi:serine hydrolase domain-containing protein [Pedobacter agri]|uniref:serine hydrolase domain-containing protein n=1 Tax=Pedobacter agri TaxID=454586 RepID=UPI00292F4672|nr:serine hydrolase domain-containing protein [Pedobacter agri]
MIRIITLISCLLISFNTFSQNTPKQKLDSVFSMMHAQNQFSGTVLIAECGNIVFSKGYGFQDSQSTHKNTRETIYELASCSKQFTAAAIVLLHREGKLMYEDNLGKFIPELSRWNQVTIYDLLRHTSGIPEYLIDMSGDWDHSKIATNDDLVSFYASRKDSLTFTPGSQHRYCNTNYALLATIISRISGMSLAEFSERNIFAPLKMNHTFIYNSRQHPKVIKGRAIGYVWKKNSFDKITSENPDYGDSLVYYLDGIVGNAKVNSTVIDVYKWVTALKNNSFFTPEEFSLMTSVTKTSNGRSVPYGFGLDLSGSKDNRSFGHTGSWDGYSTFIYHNMGKDRTIITLQNFKMGAYPFKTINQIIDNDPIGIEYTKKISLQRPDVEKFAGNYIDKEDKLEEHQITFLDGYLIYNTKAIKWDMRFFPISKNQFKAIRQGGSDGELRFSEMENGDIKLEMLQYGKTIGSGLKKN